MDDSPLKLLLNIDFELSDDKTELVKKVRWIIRLRYVISPAVVLMMLFTGWQGLTREPALTQSALFAVLITAAIAVLLNTIYFFTLRMRPLSNLRAFVVLQLAVDVLLFTSYVYRSGGVTSPFSFLYLLPIIAGAILVSTSASMALAGVASASYVAILSLAASGVIEHISYFVALDDFAHKWSYVLLMMLVNSFAFFMVAGISSFLMRTVRQKTNSLTAATLSLDRKVHLLGMLYDVARAAVGGNDAKDVIDEIGEILVAGLSLDRVLVYIKSEDGQFLELEREFYHPRLGDEIDRASLEVKIALEEDAGVTARAALRQMPENVTDPASHPLINRELAKKIGINPFAVAPMVIRGKMLGVIGVDRCFDAGGEIDDDAFQVLIAFADQAAVTLRTAQLES
jgi:hypothetical protein